MLRVRWYRDIILLSLKQKRQDAVKFLDVISSSSSAPILIAVATSHIDLAMA